MSTKTPATLEILLCDARVDPPQLQIHHLDRPQEGAPTVGWALQSLKIAKDKDDPVLSRKGCYGVFGKRKDWDSPLYAGDRLELYAPLRQFVSFLGAAASPCALVSIGLFLVQKTSAPTTTTWSLVFVKLILQPFVVWVVADPILGLPTFWVYAAVLVSALPTGTGPFMLAQYYRADGSLISRVVLITTLGSVITLSALVWWMTPH